MSQWGRKPAMTSHELARRLLELPDLPVSTHANNHTYEDAGPWGGKLKVRLAKDWNGIQSVRIGNLSDLTGP